MKEASASPKDAALKLALEALEPDVYRAEWAVEQDREKAITAIKAALAQPTSGDYAHGYVEGFNDACMPKPAQQEPVAWITKRNVIVDGLWEEEITFSEFDDGGDPVYYTLPQRTWIGLTDEEILDVNMSTVTKVIDEPIVCDTDHNIIQLGKAIEAKLKEKNT